MSEVNKPEQLGVTESGDWVYPSASSTGHVEIEVPTLPGSLNPTERLHVRDFGTHVVGKIDSAFKRGVYVKTGPQQSAADTFKHYVACAKGAQLMDKDAISRMEALASEFASVPEREEYFSQVVKPHLLSLTPKRW